MSPVQARDLCRRFARPGVKGHGAILRLIEWAIVAMGVVFPLAAIRHAANAVEATLGIGAVVIVVGVAAFRGWNRHAEHTALGASVREFDDAARSLRSAELRFALFLWLVLGVECAFAAVWWYGGIEVHHGALTPIAIGMLWVPLAVVVLTLVWSIRLRATARRELDRLDARAGTSVSGAEPGPAHH